MSSKNKIFSLQSPKHQFTSNSSSSTSYSSATSTTRSLSTSRLGGGAPLPTSIKSSIGGGGGTPKGKASILSHVPTYTFPEPSAIIGNNNDLSPFLSPLRDNASSYESVTKSCLHLSQFAGRAGSSESNSNGGSNNNNNRQDVVTSALYHDASYAQTVSSALSALMDCIQNHYNRKCRIVASKTLASFARSVYTRLRHTPLLFAVRDGTLHRLEDEVGTDVAVSLATVALEDVDDGVSACAVEALGMLVLSPSCSEPGSLVDDELQREIEGIANIRPSPYAPSLSTLSDEDLSVPQMELQVRIYENVLSPRLWRLVHRITLYESSSHIARTLPFVTSCLVHIVKISPAKMYGIERTAYAKQWMELDSAGLVHDLIHLIILPAMQSSSSFDSHLAYAAALSGLRLAHVCPNALWMREICELAVQVCTEQLAGAEVVPDHKKMTLAATLIALRAIPLSDRLWYLTMIMNEVRFLPSTTMVPYGVSSPGVMLSTENDGKNTTCYRTPSRIGIITEIALSLLVDGPLSQNSAVNERSNGVAKFLSSSVVSTILATRSKTSDTSGNGNSSSIGSSGKGQNETFAGTHTAEELVYVFCTTVSAIGRCIVMKPKNADNNEDGMSSMDELDDESADHVALLTEEWLRCSYTVLSNLSACLNWHSRTTNVERAADNNNDEDQDPGTLFTMGLAAKASYMQLLQESLYVVGLLSPSTSVSLTILPLEAPAAKSVLLDQLCRESLKLSKCWQRNHYRLSNLARANLKNLMDQIVEYKLREGLSSRHMRVFLLSLLADHWVQQRHSTSLADLDNHEAVTYHGMAKLDDINAREILANLSAEIAIESAIQSKLQEPSEKNPTKGYLSVCVACIENMALTACDMKRRFREMSSNNFSKVKDDSFLADFEDDANYILSISMLALRGKNLKDGDESDNVDEEERGADTLPLCAAAAKRIETANLSETPMQEDTAWGLGSQPALYSDLVVDRDMNGWTSPKKNRYNQYLDLHSLVDGVGSDKDNSSTTDARCYAHMWLLCRQSVLSRIDGSFLSSPLGDAYIHNISQGGYLSRRAIQRNWLRLAPSQVPLSWFGPSREDAETELSWKSSVIDVTAASDPVSVTLAFVVKRIPRYDYEREYRLTVTMRLHNVTAVEIADGLRLELGITQSVPTSEADLDLISKEIAEALGSDASNATNPIAACATTVYKPELAAGDHLTWELSLGNLPTKGSLTLCPFIVFRGIEIEHSVSSWVGPSISSSTNNTADDEEDMFESEDDGDEDETIDMRLAAEPVQISPIISLQPCPLVFFRNGSGDMDTFRTLWFHAPYKIPTLSLRDPDWNPANLSSMSWHGVAALSSISVPEGLTSDGTVIKIWAFMNFSGKRVFCVTMKEKNGDSKCTLQVRGDDKDLLLSLFGTESARSEVIYTLTSAVWLCTIDGMDGRTLFEA